MEGLSSEGKSSNDSLAGGGIVCSYVLHCTVEPSGVDMSTVFGKYQFVSTPSCLQKHI